MCSEHKAAPAVRKGGKPTADDYIERRGREHAERYCERAGLIFKPDTFSFVERRNERRQQARGTFRFTFRAGQQTMLGKAQEYQFDMVFDVDCVHDILAMGGF